MIKKQESNFKKAVNELLGYSSGTGDETDIPDYKEELRAAMQEARTSEEVLSPDQSSFFNPSGFQDPPAGQAPVRMTAETSKVSSYTVETKTLFMEPVNQISSKVAVITEDMIVNGDIVTQSDLNIYGQVTGSVASRGDVLIMGRVTGDVSGVNVRVEGEVNGNLTVDKRADVGVNGRIKGDITAANVFSEGVSEGDVKAEDTIHFGGSAMVTGKVYAKAFAIIQGAKIKGMMTTYD